MKCGKNINGCFHNIASKNNIIPNKYYAEVFIKTTCIEIQSQHWGVNRQLSMEDIAVQYLTI